MRTSARCPAVWAACLLVSALTACAQPPDPRPERVVLASIDTLRADRVGCYGDPRAHTPALDTIAARGVRFELAVAPTPLTLPSHASLLTGLDPPAHGVRHNGIHRLGDAPATLAERMEAAGYASAAFVGAFVLERRYGLARGFRHYDDEVGPRGSGAVGFAERRADRVVDAALDWLERAPDRFFIWVHFYDPHAPYDPPPGFASAFPGRPYAGEIAFADSQLARLLDGIRARWGDAGLLVVAVGDHGESLGEHAELTHSYGLYDATQRVPLVASGPGLPVGRVATELVRLVDVAPTLLARVGAAALPGASGRDLRGVLEGRGPERPAAYLETLATRLDFGWSPLLGVRTQRFKYVRAPRPELYDLAADPAETRNLAALHPELVERLDRRLEGLAGAERSAAAVLAPSPDELLRLRALGYQPASAGEPGSAADAVGGPDPKDQRHVLRALAEAEALLALGRFAEALGRLDSLRAGGAAVSALRASAALGAGDPVRAEHAARRALAAQPGRSDLLALLARALEVRAEAAEGRDPSAGSATAEPRAADESPVYRRDR